MASYACHELDSKNSNVLHERTLAVTHTDILILSPNPDYLALGLLLNQISLLSIYTLSRSQTSPEKITLKFTKAGKSKQFTRIFLMYQGSDLLSLVSGNYQKLNPTNNILKITEKNEIDLNEPENQEILLDKIANFERKIHKTRQIKQLETLVKLYQKAIQTYSDLDPKFSHKLLQKMHVFLSKPEIMKLFESKTVLK